MILGLIFSKLGLLGIYPSSTCTQKMEMFTPSWSHPLLLWDLDGLGLGCPKFVLKSGTLTFVIIDSWWQRLTPGYFAQLPSSSPVMLPSSICKYIGFAFSCFRPAVEFAGGQKGRKQNMTNKRGGALVQYLPKNLQLVTMGYSRGS